MGRYCGCMERNDRREPRGAVSEAARVFREAAGWVPTLARGIGAEAWAGPGLGAWDLRALLGHTSRALSTVSEYLRRPAEREALRTPVDYFRAAAAIPGADAAAVLQRGIAAGEELGDDPAGAFERIARAAIDSLPEVGDPLIPSIAGGIRLSSYLPTRTFELVVHGLDICAATGRPADPPPAALRETLHLAADLACAGGAGPELLRAATGRSALRLGFSVL